MTLKNKIIEYSKEIGIEIIRFCSSEPFLGYRKVLEERIKKSYNVPFEEQNIDKRIYPELTLPGAKSFIVIGESYNIEKNANKSNKNKLTGNITVSAVGLDYHTSVMKKLEALEEFITLQTDCKIKKFVDISPFSDRQIAERAGLGFYGRNTMIINKKYGSRFFIGYLLTNIELEPDQRPDFVGCAHCQRCVRACPTGAIIGDGSFNGKVCISYLTQHKGEMKEHLKKYMGTHLYGCDICQKVCPYNEHIQENRVIDPILPLNIELDKILNITNKEFKKIFGPTSVGWRGKKWIQRNAIINLGNSKSEQALELLEKLSTDQRKEIRWEVAWALGQFTNKRANDILNKMLVSEKEDDIKNDITYYLSDN
ncbi:MAG: tRNA epoxyqueuosine(34) reductase QueG [bacterium]